MVKRLDGELFHLRCRDPTHEQEDPRRNIAERPYEMLPLIEKKKEKRKMKMINPSITCCYATKRDSRETARPVSEFHTNLETQSERQSETRDQ